LHLYIWVPGQRLPHKKIQAVDRRQPELARDLPVHGIDFQFSQYSCALEQKNSNQLTSRGLPAKVADDRLATIQAQGRAFQNVHTDRRTSTLSTPRHTDSFHLRTKAPEIIRTVLEHPVEQFELFLSKRPTWFSYIHRGNPLLSLA